MVRVRVPASSANMGAGFDTLGIALNLYSVIEAEETSGGLEIITKSGGGVVHNDETNLVYRAMDRVFKKVEYKPQGIKIMQDSKIPMTRGLGSSSACIIGGMLAANVLSGRRLTYPQILDLATEMEGHPDNVAPAMYGGLCVSARVDGKTVVKSTKLCHKIKFAVMIPDFFFATRKSRGVLPDTVEFQSAVGNISKALMFYSSLVEGDFKNLRYGVGDMLHQPYRKHYITGYDDIFDMTYECGAYATYLSGSGPTVMSIIDGDDLTFKGKMEQFFRDNAHKWRCIILECDNVGSVVAEINRKERI